MKYWALDYVNGMDNECELIYNDKLYATEQDAEVARENTGRPDLFDITWYTLADLREVFNCKTLMVTDDLRIVF